MNKLKDNGKKRQTVFDKIDEIMVDFNKEEITEIDTDEKIQV